MDSERLECLFPRLESLLELHTHFLSQLKERQRESLVSPGDRNYTVSRVADILIAQVSSMHAQKTDCTDFITNYVLLPAQLFVQCHAKTELTVLILVFSSRVKQERG